MDKTSRLSVWNILFDRIPEIKKYLLLSAFYQMINAIDYMFWSVVYLRFIMYCIKIKMPFSNIMYCFILLSIVMYAICRYSGWFELKKKPIEHERIRYILNKQIFAKIYDLSIYQLEKQSEICEKYKIMHLAQDKLIDFLVTFCSLIGRLVMCISILGVVVLIDKFVVFILILPILTTKILGEKLINVDYEYDQNNVTGNLKKNYVKRCYSEKIYAGEIKTTNISNALNALYTEGSQHIINNNCKYALSRVTLSFLIELFKNRIPYSMILGYAVYQVMVARSLDVMDISVVLIGLVNLSDRLGELTTII